MEPDDSDALWDSIGPPDYDELFSAVFGDSDTDEDSSCRTCIAEEVDRSSDGWTWEKVEEVEGLWHCSQFLSVKQQQALLKAIHAEGWFSDPQHNQAMKFGDLPDWAVVLSALIQRSIGDHKDAHGLEKLKSNRSLKIEILPESLDWSSPLPSAILQREPLFDQMIVNLYEPGEGIKAHVDLLRFEDGIAIVSLESTCVMSFRSADASFNAVPYRDLSERMSDPGQHAHPSTDGSTFVHEDSLPGRPPHDEVENSSEKTTSQVKLPDSTSHKCLSVSGNGVLRRVDVLLNPGDLIITHGPARYNWTHEITRGDKDRQVWQGHSIVQQRRVSVTFRRLCRDEDGK